MLSRGANMPHTNILDVASDLFRLVEDAVDGGTVYPLRGRGLLSASAVKLSAARSDSTISGKR
jgi:hypothetical protein